MKMMRLKGAGGLGLSMAVLGLWAIHVQAAPADSEVVSGKDSMFELLMKGGYVMIPLGLCSLLAMALALERFISLSKERMFPADFLKNLGSAFKAKGQDGALSYCGETGPVGAVFGAGVRWLGRGDDKVEKALEDAAAREASKLKRSLRGLSLIATIAPLLGLAGTVYGMINSFQQLSVASGGPMGDRTQGLVTGIYEALVTTAAGLSVAIPVLIVYSILIGRVDKVVDEITELGDEFMLSFDGQPTVEG